MTPGPGARREILKRGTLPTALPSGGSAHTKTNITTSTYSLSFSLIPFYRSLRRFDTALSVLNTSFLCALGPNARASSIYMRLQHTPLAPLDYSSPLRHHNSSLSSPLQHSPPAPTTTVSLNYGSGKAPNPCQSLRPQQRMWQADQQPISLSTYSLTTGCKLEKPEPTDATPQRIALR